MIKVPVRAPKARAHAERWVGSMRRECLDRVLIVGRRHLALVMKTYALHYNQHRPHRALRQRAPLGERSPTVSYTGARDYQIVSRSACLRDCAG